MEKHILAILERAECWSWPTPTCMEGPGGWGRATTARFKTAVPKLLSGFVAESHFLGGNLANEVWSAVEKCHPQVKENIEELRRTEYSSPERSELLLFDGVDREMVDLGPVFELAAELFTHLGVVFMKMEGPRFARYPTPLFDEEDNDWEALHLLALKRDGTLCPLTGVPFFVDDYDPVLTRVIPPSFHDKPDTLKYITLLAGETARDVILETSDTINNVMNIEANAASSYRHSKWGVEASSAAGGLVKYIFRDIPFDPDQTHNLPPHDGDEIHFGAGPEGEQLHHGPHPLLCNIRLAVSRVLSSSGTADFITQLMVDADDTAYPHVALKDNDFHDILNAKLLISGRALMV